MRSSLLRVGLVATLGLSTLYGCEESESPAAADDERGRDQGSVRDGGRHDQGHDVPEDEDLEDEDLEDEDFEDEDFEDETSVDVGPTSARRTQVPDELVGAWKDGALDFVLWENYPPGQYAGRYAVPSREAMVLSKNGDAKFYRYEFARNLYEELIDCEGTVAFHGNGTFTFYPVRGRKRFFDNTHSERNVDRPLTAEELRSPKLAGTRAYEYIPGSSPPTVRIKVPTSAPYNWYQQ